MKTQVKLRLQLWMQNSFFVILFLLLIGLLGWISHQYHIATDVTQSSRNILSEGSVNVLKQMKSPIHITVFASADNASHGETYRKGVKDFIYRYQRTIPQSHATSHTPPLSLLPKEEAVLWSLIMGVRVP